ncbi:MAG TPA: hypothetical protein VIF09_19940 [Polyangiaceae bacterium]|jgi:hypothetical protein
MASERLPRQPSFASDFPRAPELDALVDAFARGDYARVRADAPRLSESTTDEKVRAAALTLLARTRPDPLAVGLLAITALLLLAFTAYWVVHGRAPAGATRTAPAPTVERVR